MFLILIPSISAQEAPPALEEPSEGEEQFSFDERAAELAALETAISFEDSQSAAQGAGPSVWDLIKMLLVLALVAAAVYGIVFLFKKTSKPASANDPFLKVLASSHLGSGRYVHVVSVAGKAWLVGSGDNSVNLIAEVEDKDAINAMLLEESKKSAEAVTGRFPDFLGILRKMGTPAGNRSQSADEIRKRRERLKGL